MILNILYNYLFFPYYLNISKYIMKYKLKFHSRRRRNGINKKGTGKRVLFIFEKQMD